MRLALRRPRLLPLTCAALAGLITLKSIDLVQAAVAGPEQAAGPDPASQAPAKAAAPPPSGGSQPPQPHPGAMLVHDESAAPPPPAISDEERALLLDLRHRRDMLDKKARLLDQRGAEMAAADRKLDARVQQLAALQAQLESLESDRQQRQAANWTGLVKTYEAMKPRDAAAIFDALDMQVLLQVLDRMQERRAAAVLAAMQPDRARLATQLLAELRTRANALAPAAGNPNRPVPQSDPRT